MKQMTFLFGSILFLFLFGCKKEKDNIQVIFDHSKFLEMKQSWESLNINNYSYAYSHSACLCFAFKYVVNNNMVVKVDPDTSTCHSIGPYLTYTIDKIFSDLEEIYNNPYKQKIDDNTYIYCKEIRIKYDSNYFFPSYYEILFDLKNMELHCPQEIEILTNFIKQ